MSPVHDQFNTFTPITPKPIKAADQTLFIATAMGELQVCVPNGNSMTTVTLKNVLYCPDLAFMLISLMQCNMAGYSALLKNRRCTISHHVDWYWAMCHLQKVCTSTCTHIKLPRPPILHTRLCRWMISINGWAIYHPLLAKKLVKDGHVTGLSLDIVTGLSLDMSLDCLWTCHWTVSGHVQ